MNAKTLDRAVSEARRFIAAAEAAQKGETRSYETNGRTITYTVREGVLNGAVKRASMDLTRALADLRANR